MFEFGVGRALEEVLVDLEESKSEIELSRELYALVAKLVEVDTKFKMVAQKFVTPMVVFTVPHVPWDLKPIAVPRALAPKLAELLNKKLRARILERSDAPYSNCWFTVRKKNGSLRFIQDMQPPNRATIRNVGVGPLVDEFAEEFLSRAIYSMGDLFLGYDQFQLAKSNRDITTMRTPLGLLRMCTLPHGATNSVAHMQNAMSKILEPFIPRVTRPFIDDIPSRGVSFLKGMRL
ncbi:unnamed protein product [Calypogeia fissa]